MKRILLLTTMMKGVLGEATNGVTIMFEQRATVLAVSIVLYSYNLFLLVFSLDGIL